MSESHDPIQLKSTEGSLVSQDGRHVLVKCHGYDGKVAEIIIPTEALENVWRNLQLLSKSASLVMHTSNPVQVPTVKFEEPEPIFFVTALGGIVRPETGLIELRIGETHGGTFQVSMVKEQSRVLYDLLLDVFAAEDDKPQ